MKLTLYPFIDTSTLLFKLGRYFTIKAMNRNPKMTCNYCNAFNTAVNKCGLAEIILSGAGNEAHKRMRCYCWEFLR